MDGVAAQSWFARLGPFGATGRGFPLIVAVVAAGSLRFGEALRDFWVDRALAVPAAQGARLHVALAVLVLLRAAAVFTCCPRCPFVRCRLQRSRFTLSFVGTAVL